MWVSLLQKQYTSKLPEWVEGSMYVECRWRYYYIKSFRIFIHFCIYVCVSNKLVVMVLFCSYLTVMSS